MKFFLLIAFVAVMGDWTVAAQPGPSVGERNRSDFAKALARIDPGMTAEQVVATIGKPDDVRTPYDPGEFPANLSAEIWGYGTEGHLSFPTLGCIYLDQDTVQRVSGGKGTPPNPGMFREDDLRSILRQIDKTSGQNPDPLSVAVNPLSLIQTVNRLQALGKDKALAAIGEYERVDGSRQIPIFLVLRLLFEVPTAPGFMPRMLVGEPTPKEPKDPTRLPLFPLVLLDDVPLYCIQGYALAGFPESVQEHIEYFRKNGMLREHPLRPTDDPLAALAKLEQSPQWLYGHERGSAEYSIGQQLLANQLLRLVDSVYRIEPNQHGVWFENAGPAAPPPGYFDQKRWDGIVREFTALHARWDPAQNTYVFPDGTSLPAITKPFHRRSIWELPPIDRKGALILERLNKDYIQIILQYRGSAGVPLAESTLGLYGLGSVKERIAQFGFESSAGSESPLETAMVGEAKLADGETAQAEILYKGKTIVSPVFTP